MHKIKSDVFVSRMRKIAVITNNAAGSGIGSGISNRITAAFADLGTEALVIEARGRDLRKAVRALLAQGYDTITAGGGDGTLSTVASEMAGRSEALGVLPLGTLNHFARDLGVPLDLDKAIALVCSDHSRRVDIGQVNGHSFINNASLGLYPDQLRLRQVWQSRIGKWPAVVVASFAVFRRFPYLNITAEFNGNRLKRRCPMVLISNNKYRLEPSNLTGREQLDEGLLGIYMLRDEGRAGLVQIALHSLVFKPEEADSFESHCATELRVMIRSRRVKVALDGEVYRLSTPLRFSVLPGGLRVIAPEK